MLIEVKATTIISIDKTNDVSEENRHWLFVAQCIVEANEGKPNSNDINPLIPKIEQRYGAGIWELLLKICNIKLK